MKDIKRMRLRKHLTQQEVADAIGVKREYYNKLEGEHASPSIDKVEQIAEALGCSLQLIDEHPTTDLI